MRYQKTIEIHKRLETVLQLIGTGNFSTPALAETIGVSIPTISRIVAVLREQGHDIRAERRLDGWRYVLDEGRSFAPRSKSAVGGDYRHAGYTND
jgi:biotin operon repressor